jgi:putative intracellular protease/amidase
MRAGLPGLGLVTASAVGARSADASQAGRGPSDGRQTEEPGRPLATSGALAAAVVTATGLGGITLLVLAGWIAAPHFGLGLPAVLRTAATLWLAGHHVGFTLRGAGRIGMLPLGLVVLPGALLWRAGRWVVRAARVRRLRDVGAAAVALAVPYALLTGVLAVASKSPAESSSLLQSVACGLLLALVAGGLGGARALATWPRLIQLLPERTRALVVGVAGALAALMAAGALLAGIALAVHLSRAANTERALDPGAVGALLLVLLQLGYLPNAITWTIAFMLGPGFAFGSATVVAPTGSALAQLPAFPMLAALPAGVHPAMAGWLEPAVLSVPYAAGVLGGLLLVRATRQLALDAAPLWGLAAGIVCGMVLGVLAAVSGGPLGDGRLATIGPSPWQVGVVSALEIGVSAAVTAGAANYLAMRRTGELTALSDDGRVRPRPGNAAQTGHVIFVDPWAGEAPRAKPRRRSGPSALP